MSQILPIICGGTEMDGPKENPHRKVKGGKINREEMVRRVPVRELWE